MADPIVDSRFDLDAERYALRKAGMLGSGRNENRLFAIAYDSLPREARTTIDAILAGGPFVRPDKDGTRFGDNFGDLPSGEYMEFTVPTPGVRGAGARRLVARKTTGTLFFTACHYERIHVTGGSTADRNAARSAATAACDADYRNGFYVVTGMPIALRNALRDAIRTKY